MYCTRHKYPCNIIDDQQLIVKKIIIKKKKKKLTYRYGIIQVM